MIIFKIQYRYDICSAKLQTLKMRVDMPNVERIVQNKQLDIDRICDKMANKIQFVLQNNINKTTNLISRIDALSPLKVMSRGFSAVYKDGKHIKSVGKLKYGDNITIKRDKTERRVLSSEEQKKFFCTNFTSAEKIT